MELAKKRYTYADVLAWEDDTRYELYDGEPRALASPSSTHQRISTELLYQLRAYLEGKRCAVYHAPFDVRLFERAGEQARDVKNVVQPDLVVICDPAKIDERGCKGAPDLIIEILSPATQRQDRVVKYQLYQRACVPEYWIVNPQQRTVAVHTLEDGRYCSPIGYSEKAVVPVGVLDNCEIDFAKVFA